MILGIYRVLGETTRNPTNTMVKPLDSNRAVAVVEKCMSCLVSRSISNIRVVYALARRQQVCVIKLKKRQLFFFIANFLLEYVIKKSCTKLPKFEKLHIWTRRDFFLFKILNFLKLVNMHRCIRY